MKSAIIIYYSKSGITKELAEKIKNDINCDILEVEAEKPYGSYISAVLRVAVEKTFKKVPAFATVVPDLSGYDTVFIGCPVWYSKTPQFFSEFLKQCDFNGKTLIPFITFGGKGFESTVKEIRSICSNSKIELPYCCGAVNKADYSSWIKSVKAFIF